MCSDMIALINYPFYLVRFWYIDVLWGLVVFFGQLNRYLISLLSYDLLIKTFFKPLKNEYRKGLVLFSILFGIFIKSFLISILTLIFILILILEVLILLLIAAIPVFLIPILLGKNSIMWYE